MKALGIRPCILHQSRIVFKIWLAQDRNILLGDSSSLSFWNFFLKVGISSFPLP